MRCGWAGVCAAAGTGELPVAAAPTANVAAPPAMKRRRLNDGPAAVPSAQHRQRRKKLREEGGMITSLAASRCTDIEPTTRPAGGSGGGGIGANGHARPLDSAAKSALNFQAIPKDGGRLAFLTQTDHRTGRTCPGRQAVPALLHAEVGYIRLRPA